MAIQTIDTDSPEFRKIMEDAYSKAYSYGVKHERERCAAIVAALKWHFVVLLDPASTAEIVAARVYEAEMKIGSGELTADGNIRGIQ